jgi:FkbM family methyltransferase
MKLTKYLFKSLKYYSKFGINGFIFISKIYWSDKGIIKFSNKKIKNPIYLRNNSTDYNTFSQIFYSEEYNFSFVGAPKVIVDCGANIGLSAVYFKNRFPDAKIIAIEPDNGNFEFLLKNTECYPDIICIKAGIWSFSTNLEIVDLNVGEWGYMVKPVEFSTESTIEGISLKEIIESYNLEYIDILKVDIEGSEKELFEAGQDEWLPYINTLIVETHDRFKKGTAKSIFKALIKYDFNFSTKGENLLFDFKSNNF